MLTSMRELVSFLKSRRGANLTIAVINIFLFIIMEIVGDTTDASFMIRCGACYDPLVRQGEYWRLFTSMFLHFGFLHLTMNMFSLIVFGDILEGVLGHLRYLFIYLAGGLFGNLCSLTLSLLKGRTSVSAGASGAVFSVIGALFYIAFRNRKEFGKVHMKRMSLMVILMIAEGAFDLSTDEAAHVGGFAAGFLLGILLYRKEKDKTNAEALLRVVKDGV